ncbi:unnamed protein product [Lactuca saligna]|uniref:Uncharacterized protein n=1 Tax=Lactuca saligna TaxID=75948 RepID=A0AA36EFB6_LACSI|nr:unnamed protein product [Lactuca saligna]
MIVVLISFAMDLIIGSSGGVETIDVVGMVLSVKICEDIGIEIRGRDVSIQLICGRGGIDDIKIDEVGIYRLISEQDTPKKNWQRHWLWVKRNPMGHGFRRTQDLPDCHPNLFGSNLSLGKLLANIAIIGENWEDFILDAAGMSVAWRAHGKMAQLFVM